MYLELVKEVLLEDLARLLVAELRAVVGDGRVERRHLNIDTNTPPTNQ